MYPLSDVVAVAVDLEKQGAPLKEFGLDAESIAKIGGGIPDDKLWPLVRAAYDSGLFRRIPENGIPPLSYNLSDDVDFERSPLDVDRLFPNIQLNRQPTSIAGFLVDFPLGLPASIIASNASYLKYYAQRGFCILTYKTVRSGFRKAHEHPQWVVLTNVDQQLRFDDKGLVQPSEFKGKRGRFLPIDRSSASMANSFGIPSLRPDWWMQDIAVARGFIHRGRQVLIVSVTGTDNRKLKKDNRELKEDFVRTANMAKEAGADIIELDFSCPNVSDQTASIFMLPEVAYDIAHEVKQTTKIPVFIKIGHLQDVALRALINAVSPAIDGIVAINTIPASVVDQCGQPMFPGRPGGGVSGWGIRSIAQEVAIKLVKIRDEIGRGDTLCLLGVGGVMTPDDFKSRLDTGVNAVEICTGAFLDSMIGFKIRQANSFRVPDPLARALDQAILLEQTDVHSQLRENFLLEPFHKLLIKEEREAKRLKWLSILIAVSGVLIGLGILLSLTMLWGGSHLFKSYESPTLLAPALSIASIIAVVVGVFSAWRFKRRKELLAFESEVLHRYRRTRSELLKTQVK
jgi:dihydroorotate dehydrogenase (NAD+) catalytic subunit